MCYAARVQTTWLDLFCWNMSLLQSDNQSGGDEGSAGAKRKGPMSEEDKKRRRQEINRQSARRIRERRSHEMERLKQQVQAFSAFCLSALVVTAYEWTGRMASIHVTHLCHTSMFLQNAALQQSQTLLLKYASTLAREKNVLIQRTLDLTQRWNQVHICCLPPNCNSVFFTCLLVCVQHNGDFEL